MNDFYLAVKSTIDFLASDVAKQLEIESRIDLDDRTDVDNAESNNETAVVWQLGNFKPAPRHPLYQLVFALGIRTANDPGNYELTKLIAEQEKRVAVGSEISVKDYSGQSVPSEKAGWFFVTSATVNQTQFDKMSNVRLIEINAEACSFQ